MILFLGDSFTWGQGLHYYYKIENEGWNWDDCRTFLEKNNRFEGLGFAADEFRRSNSFPYLVGKELNISISTPRSENGGDNKVIFDILTSLHPLITNANIDYLIIQFSNPTRCLDNKTDSLNNMNLDEFLHHQIS